MVEGGMRTLCGAGAFFCLLMLIVPLVFLSDNEWSLNVQAGVSTAIGALGGLCIGLYYADDSGLSSLLSHTLLGAGVGYVGFWGWWLRHLRLHR